MTLKKEAQWLLEHFFISNFTLHCKHHHLTPQSLPLKCSMKGKNADRVLIRAQKALTDERINEIKRKLDKLKLVKLKANEYLFSALSNNIYIEIKKWMSK